MQLHLVIHLLLLLVSLFRHAVTRRSGTHAAEKSMA
jgi:hypothetical protein